MSDQNEQEQEEQKKKRRRIRKQGEEKVKKRKVKRRKRRSKGYRQSGEVMFVDSPALFFSIEKKFFSRLSFYSDWVKVLSHSRNRG